MLNKKKTIIIIFVILTVCGLALLTNQIIKSENKHKKLEMAFDNSVNVQLNYVSSEDYKDVSIVYSGYPDREKNYNKIAIINVELNNKSDLNWMFSVNELFNETFFTNNSCLQCDGVYTLVQNSKEFLNLYVLYNSDLKQDDEIKKQLKQAEIEFTFIEENDFYNSFSNNFTIKADWN